MYSNVTRVLRINNDLFKYYVFSYNLKKNRNFPTQDFAGLVQNRSSIFLLTYKQIKFIFSTLQDCGI